MQEKEEVNLLMKPHYSQEAQVTFAMNLYFVGVRNSLNSNIGNC